MEVIKGKPKKKFILRAFPLKGEADDFDMHRKAEFRAYTTVGSIEAPGNCNVYGRYKTGQSYLIFPGTPSHPQSYEQVNSKKDLWYQVVKLVARMRQR